MMERVRETITELVFRIRVASAGEENPATRRRSEGREFLLPVGPASDQHPSVSHAGEGVPQPARREKKVGRNDPCPCGSGRKYKHCCGKGA